MAKVATKPAKKAVAKKPVAKKPVAKKPAFQKKPPAKTPIAQKKRVVKKAVAKKKSVVPKEGFAYGLPGNINVVGGSPLNFDPYGFLDGKSKLEVYRFRECELTHGRVGMLAAVGFIVQEKFHPLFDGVGGPAID